MNEIKQRLPDGITKSKARYCLPDNTVTSDEDIYVCAWRTMGEKLCARIRQFNPKDGNWHAVDFDPCFGIVSDNQIYLDVPMILARAIIGKE